MRRVWGLALTLLSLAVIAPDASAQQGRGQQDRRQQLEQQVRQRFMQMAVERLRLDGDQRRQLAEVVRDGTRERRELAQRGRRLQMSLAEAVRDESASEERIEEILDRVLELREQERALERREYESLSTFLSPRQRAGFLILRIRFNEQIRRMQSRGGPGGAAGPGGPPGPGVPGRPFA